MRIRGSGTGTCYPVPAQAGALPSRKRARHCVICGRALCGRRRKYCSDTCEAVAVARKANERYRASIPEPKGNCPVCGRKLEKGMRTYCCRECAKVARRRYMAEYRARKRVVAHVRG